MKIGILTHHYICNFGAFLQTYALQECLKKLSDDNDVYILNYVNKKHYIINALGWFRFNKKDTISQYFQKIKVPFIFSSSKKKMLQMTKKIKSNDFFNDFDLIVVGSDEVWNYTDKKSYDPIKFGYNLKCKRLISFSASVGKSASYEDLPNYAKLGLNNFKDISVRDKLTYDFAKHFFPKPILTMDPTFLYDFDTSKFDLKYLKEKYILFYYCDNISKELFITIKKFAEENDLKLYGAGESNKFFDKSFINISPIEWVSLFKNAYYIFTGTFHGVVFSIKYKKNFNCFLTNSSRTAKIISLLKQLCLEDRIIENSNHNLFSRIDYKLTDKILNGNIIESFNYLKKNMILSGDQNG